PAADGARFHGQPPRRRARDADGTRRAPCDRTVLLREIDPAVALQTRLPRFTFATAALRGEEFLVTRVRGREALSELYAFTIGLSAAIDHDALGMLVGTTASLRIDASGLAPRCIAGVVAQVRARGTPHPGALTRFSVTLVPRAWLLRQDDECVAGFVRRGV